jgi:hypothetical protein
VAASDGPEDKRGKTNRQSRAASLNGLILIIAVVPKALLGKSRNEIDPVGGAQRFVQAACDV